MTDLAALIARGNALVEATLPRHERAIPFCPHTPTPAQRRFLEVDAIEALYGGAAGGGKSDALLMAALMYADRPGHALILRRTYADLSLPGAIMDRARQWLAGSGAEWNGTEKRFTFPSGYVLAFGYCETPQDVYRYMGSEFQLIEIDELTQWPEQPYRYLLSRLRRGAGVETPLRMRAASNPGGVGHEWVKARFVDPGDPSRPFVPARLGDNPHLDREEYERSLALLDEETRAQLRDGLWEQDRKGLIYRGFDATRNHVNALPDMTGKPGRWHALLAIDLGASELEPTSGFAGIWWHDHDPRVFVERAWVEAGLIPSDVAGRAMAYEEHVKSHGAVFEGFVLDEGALGKGYGGELRRRYGLACRAAEKRDKLGMRKLLNGDLERGLVVLVRDACVPLAKELGNLRWNPAGLDALQGMPDHASDALLYGYRRARGYDAKPAPEAAPVYGSDAWHEQQAKKAEDRAYAEAASRIQHEREAPWERW